MRRLYTFHNLQGSQTEEERLRCEAMLYTFHNLQGSQTVELTNQTLAALYTFHNLQGSQTNTRLLKWYMCFTPFITYKVLKLPPLSASYN